MRFEAKAGLATHLMIYVVVNVVLVIVAGTPWLWVTLFWGIGLAFHAFGVFVSPPEQRSDD